MGNDFEVIIDEKTERYNEFMKIFGTNIIKVKSPFPHLIKTREKEVLKEVLAYFFDLELLTREQRENLIVHLSEKFNQSKEFVEKNLETLGVPILAEGCTLVIHNPQRWFD